MKDDANSLYKEMLCSDYKGMINVSFNNTQIMFYQTCLNEIWHPGKHFP